MSTDAAPQHIRHPDRFFIGGEWVQPSSRSRIDVRDSATEEVFLCVAEAQVEDVDRAVTAARKAFDQGPWPRMTHQERAAWLLKIADAWTKRADAIPRSRRNWRPRWPPPTATERPRNRSAAITRKPTNRFDSSRPPPTRPCAARIEPAARRRRGLTLYLAPRLTAARKQHAGRSREEERRGFRHGGHGTRG